MNKKLPLFELDINDDNDDNKTGVLQISLVKKPAIEVNFLKFAEDQEPVKYSFAVTDKALQIVSGPILIPGLIIYRNDNMGQYNITITKETIYKIVQKFARTQRPTSVDLEHGADGKAPGCYLFQNFIIDKTLGIQPPTNFEDLPDGTWFGLMKVDDPDIWASVEDGTFKGFSIEGFFDLVPATKLSANDMMVFSQLQKIIESTDFDDMND